MVVEHVCTGVIIDEAALSLFEFAKACKVEPSWVVERVRDGILSTSTENIISWRFNSAELVRARRLIATERAFDASAELAALVVDLIEQLDNAKRQLRTLETL